MITIKWKDGTKTDYPGCDGAMPFAGNPGWTAVVKINKENPDLGPHEVVALMNNEEVEKIEEAPDEG